MIHTAHSSTNRIMTIASFIVIGLGVIVVWVLPIALELRAATLGLGMVASIYNIVIANRRFDQSRFWRAAIPALNVIFITGACFLLGNAIPMLITVYLIAIGSVAVRAGLPFALWSASLSALGLLIVVAGAKTPHTWFDALTLIGVFFFVAFLTGVLAEMARHRLEHLEDAIRAHARGDREMEAERAVTQAVNQTLDLDQVLNLALDRALAALHLDAGGIFLADDAQATLTLAVSRNIAPETVALVRTHLFGAGITGSAASQRRIMVSPNVHEDPRIHPSLRAHPAVYSQVSAPLIARDRVVGVLSITTRQPYDFTADDIALVQTIGASIAVAIDRARWIDTLDHRVAERTAELTALNRITQAVSASLDLDEIIRVTVDELARTLNVRGVWMRLFNAEKQTLELRLAQGWNRDPTVSTDLHFGEGISGRIAQDLRARALNILESDLSNRAELLTQGYHSIAGAPMIVAGNLVGVLGMASDQPDRFSAEDLRWLESVGNAVAVAIQNARLYESRERRAAQLATLREIDHTLNSMLELTPMLETMLVVLARIVQYDSAAVLLLRDQILRSVAERGKRADQLRDFELNIATNAIFQEMAYTRAPMIINDWQNDPRWVTVRGTESGRAWLGAPLIARGELIGQIGLFSDTPHAFMPEHSDLLMAFADHAAITIANSQLRAELRKQARRDSLTDALNHGAFIEELRHVSNGIHEALKPLALIMLDLDNYKQYNDKYGHVVGDQVLRVAVQAIRAHIHHDDLVGRWGGEEFGVALPGADLDRAQTVATRIRATLAETEIRDARGKLIPPPTASQGIAAIPATARNGDELIDRADHALYQAKARGRDQVVVWSANRDTD